MNARASQERTAELAALIARHSTASPGLIGQRVPHLQRLAHQAKRAEENYCNLPDYPRDAKIERLQKHADRIAAELGPAFKIHLGGDCRGPCAVLEIAGEKGDGWDDNGWAIY